MALLLGLITAMALGVGDFIAGQVTKRVPTLIVVLYAQVFGALIMVPTAIISGHSLTFSAVIWGLLAGVSLGIGFMLYFRSLSLGKMGVVSSLTGILSAIIPVFTGLLIGERPGAGALFAVVLIVFAITFITKKEAGSQTPVKSNTAVLAQAALAGILIGLFFVFLHIPGARESMWTVSFAMTGSFLPVAAILFYRRADIYRVSKNAWGYILANGFLQTFATITYVLGVNIGLMSIVALAGALSPLFTVICARVIINERLNKTQIAGFVFALTGVALLVVSS
ncbi:DMT family transporter [Evansella clarkii]|uniref:DMT family transporter n=1 Tax=Evansella clarkii TaxID=79879 RepID=UPI0009989089|nr:DMT family transporter [Evansella clarkii]